MKRAFLLLAIAFGVRLLCGIWLGHFQHPQLWEFEEMANNLLAGRGLIRHQMGAPYYAYVLPVYPLFTAGVYAMTAHSRTAVLLIQCLIGAFAAIQVKAIGELVFEDSRVSTFGAWLVAFHPPLILFATRLHSLTLDVFALLWVLWAWLLLLRAPRAREALHAGIAGGFALLSRGTALAFLAWAAAVTAWALRHQALRRIQVLAVAALVSGAVVLPWLIRNAIVLHRFPVLITTTGQSLWQGNNPNSSGSGYLPDGRSALDTLPQHMLNQLKDLDELGQDRMFRQEAMRFIREHPGQTFGLYLKKLRLFWWAGPQTGLKYPRHYRVLYGIYYAVVAALAIIGLWRWRLVFRRPPGLLLVGFAVSISLLQSVYYVEGRHRWGIEPVLLLLAAAGLLECLKKARGHATA